jgi:hypothetical protein
LIAKAASDAAGLQLEQEMHVAQPRIRWMTPSFRNPLRRDRLPPHASLEENQIMKLKLATLMLASAVALSGVSASAHVYRHSHYHFFHGGYRYYSNPSAPGGGMLSRGAAWNH